MADSVHLPGAGGIAKHRTRQRRSPAGAQGKASVSAADFYAEYHGHPLDDLETLHSQVGHRPVVWLAGDSSLDNKHWFQPLDKRGAINAAGDAMGPVGRPAHVAEACNGYEGVLRPPVMVKDVAYWVNRLLADRDATGGPLDNAVCINCALEESTTADRPWGSLTPHDQFIRDRIKADDVLIVSVGGNDIALRPTPLTACNMAGLLKSCLPHACSAVPSTSGVCADGGGGCTGCCLGCCCACPSCVGYFAHLFRNRVEAFVRKLCSRQRPRLVLVCMIYYLDETRTESWANTVLGMLGYDRDPGHLQAAIRAMHRLGTARVSVPGATVVPVPMFEALDGKDSADYEHRVEPSARGGRKLAAQFVAAADAADTVAVAGPTAELPQLPPRPGGGDNG